ncbi:hypothetical protein [Ureaplasma ceti]|uniref:Uncharacterized protein n=1 Tax=Ureaplasma ceti TaxID=3119530 RepID=A0ABP9U4W0_9BACT
MNFHIFQLLTKYAQKINQFSLPEKYQRYYEIYLKLTNLLQSLDFETIAFFNKEADDIDYYANLDDLTKTKAVYLSYLTKELNWSKVNDIHYNFTYQSGHRIYREDTVSKPPHFDILIVPIQLTDGTNIVVHKLLHARFLKETSNTIIIGIGFQEALCELGTITNLTNTIKPDYLLLV